MSGKFNGNSVGIAKLQLEEEEEDLFTYLFLSLFRYYIYIYLIIDRVPSREFFSPPLSSSLSSLENFVSGKFNWNSVGIFLGGKGMVLI